MALGPNFAAPASLGTFLNSHYVANQIIANGKGAFGDDQIGNLGILLDNMVEYGKKNWTYNATGAAQDAVATLKGRWTNTDCKSLADMFVLLGNELGLGPLQARQILPPPNHRIVAKPLENFKGDRGDAGIGDRWCFGNHWIAEHVFCHSHFDPLFVQEYFFWNQVNDIYVDWFAEEVKDPTCKMGSYWTPRTIGALAAPRDARDVFFTPDGQYTFEEQRFNVLQQAWNKIKPKADHSAGKNDFRELVQQGIHK